jgi:PAS domain S-box-containing protein
MRKGTSSIRQVFLAGMISLVLVSMGLWGAIWIYGEYEAFRTESGALREKYLDAQQELLRNQVANVGDYVRYMMEQTETRLKASIKERVDEACDIAMNLYLQNRDHRTPAEIQKMIKDALRPIRFNKGRGYFFSFNLNGIEELFADRPEMEGKNMLSVMGAKGELVVRDMLDLVRFQNEGFYEYTWTKPNTEERDNPKIAYVKLFEPYGWVIGTGEYLEDVRDEIQDEVLKRIVDIRFGAEGYFFGSTFRGAPLFSNGKITKGTNNVWDLTDPNGVKIIQEQKKAAEQPGGGFVPYSWPKLESVAPVPKLAYVLGVPQWEWIIGAGVYLDTIEFEITGKREILRDNLITKIQGSLLILLPLLVLILYWVRYLSNRIQSGIDTFSSFFERAATQSITIDPGELYFREFQKLACLANNMTSDRKRAEEALRESEARLDLALRSAQMGVWQWDIIENRRYFDDQVCQLLGIKPATFTGAAEEFFRVVRPEDREKIRAAQTRTIEEDAPYLVDFRVIWPDGSVHYITTRGKLVRDNGDRPVRINGIIWDITEPKRAEELQRQLEERLQRAEKMEALGILAGGVAHDLNNVLGILVGYSELLYDEMDETSPFRDHVRNIRVGGERAAAIVQDLLALARRGVQTKTVVNLNKAVAEYLRSPEFMKLSSLHPDVRIRTELDEELLAVLGSPIHLAKTLMNLVSNAAEAMPSGGDVVISTESVYLDRPVSGYDHVQSGDYAVLTVSDSGEGISDEDIRRIFEPFYTKKVMGRSGTGLGLAVVWGTVKDHNGYIDVQSQRGIGTTFTLYFPVTREEIEKETISPSQGYMGRGEKILVVDDVKEQRELATLMLTKLGYQVSSVSSGEEAVVYLKDHGVDIVVLDMIMDPGIDGFETYRQILEIRPAQKAVIVSGFAETGRVKMAQGLGAGAYVKKPYVRERIGMAIRKELDRQA